jgi:hypothetical protein
MLGIVIGICSELQGIPERHSACIPVGIPGTVYKTIVILEYRNTRHAQKNPGNICFSGPQKGMAVEL